MKIHKHIDYVYNISNNDYPILLQDPRFRTLLLTIQAVSAISRRGECRLPAGHIYFYLVIDGQYN